MQQVISAQSTLVEPAIAPGDSGTAVLEAQQLLNREGALLVADGQFGPATKDAVMAFQTEHRLEASGAVDEPTWAALRDVSEPCTGIDSRAVTFIARAEVSSVASYNELYAAPTWPGGASGITIGIGYDLRFAADFQGDWGSLLAADSVAALSPWLGAPGSDDGVGAVAGVDVPWRAAWTVFVSRTLPQTLTQTRAVFTGLAGLPPLSAGALVSLVYNRGPSLQGSTRLEMREIRSALQAGRSAEVPGYLRGMARLWPNSRDLRGRRLQEAALFEQGLQEVN